MSPNARPSAARLSPIGDLRSTPSSDDDAPTAEFGTAPAATAPAATAPPTTTPPPAATAPAATASGRSDLAVVTVSDLLLANGAILQRYNDRSRSPGTRLPALRAVVGQSHNDHARTFTNTWSSRYQSTWQGRRVSKWLHFKGVIIIIIIIIFVFDICCHFRVGSRGHLKIQQNMITPLKWSRFIWELNELQVDFGVVTENWTWRWLD